MKTIKAVLKNKKVASIFYGAMYIFCFFAMFTPWIIGHERNAEYSNITTRIVLMGLCSIFSIMSYYQLHKLNK